MPLPASHGGRRSSSLVAMARGALVHALCTALLLQGARAGLDCEEGYWEDNDTCTLCTIEALLSSTVVNGAMPSNKENQVVGRLEGCTRSGKPKCNNAGGLSFRWTLTNTTGAGKEEVDLGDPKFRNDTLRLTLPAGTLTVGSYSLTLYAELKKEPLVNATETLSFEVPVLPVEAVIVGGDITATMDTPLFLDGSLSRDPAGRELSYEWTCKKYSGTIGIDIDCRLPKLGGQGLSNVTLALNLTAASYTDATHVFTLTVSAKDDSDRNATATTNITILSKENAKAYPDGPPPALSIRRACPPPAACPPSVPTNRKLTLKGSVVHPPEGVALAPTWSMGEPIDNTPALNLSDAALTPLTGWDLVVAAGTLRPGKRYRFLLNAAAVGEPGARNLSTSVEVQVATPPTAVDVQVHPANGEAMETYFEFTLTSEQTDAAALPLWYQLDCEVVGSGAVLPLQIATPGLKKLNAFIPVAGAKEHNHTVTVHLTVINSLGSEARDSFNVTVMPPNVTADERTSYMEGKLNYSMADVENGDVDSALLLVNGIASMLEDDGSEAEAEAVGLRSQMSEVVSKSLDAACSGGCSDSAVNTLATTAANAVHTTTKGALDETTLNNTMHVFKVLVDDEHAGLEIQSVTPIAIQYKQRQIRGEVLGENAPVELRGINHTRLRVNRVAGDIAAARGTGGWAGGAKQAAGHIPGAAVSSIVHGLSDMGQTLHGAGAPEREKNLATQALEVVNRAADLLINDLSGGEPATEVSSAMLALKVQNTGRLSDPDNPLFQGPVNVTGEGGQPAASVSFPKSLPKPASGGAVALKLLSSTADPYAKSGVSGAGGAGAAGGAPVSAVVSITLESAEDKKPLAVRDLSQPLTFSIPHTPTVGDDADAPDAKADLPLVVCSYWNEVAGKYSAAGCASQPNPAPKGAQLEWRSIRNATDPMELRTAWTITNLDQLWPGCTETDGPHFKELRGADDGWRKYVCAGDEGAQEGCRWDWRLQRFVGRECVRANHTECMCTHLTDFKAQSDLEVGDASQLPTVQMISEEQKTAVSLDDVADSVMLLSILGALMGGGIALCIASNVGDSSRRKKILYSLVANPGTEHSLFYRRTNGIRTWSIRNGWETKESAASMQTMRTAILNFGSPARVRQPLEHKSPVAAPMVAWGSEEVAPAWVTPATAKAGTKLRKQEDLIQVEEVRVEDVHDHQSMRAPAPVHGAPRAARAPGRVFPSPSSAGPVSESYDGAAEASAPAPALAAQAVTVGTVDKAQFKNVVAKQGQLIGLSSSKFGSMRDRAAGMFQKLRGKGDVKGPSTGLSFAQLQSLFGFKLFRLRILVPLEAMEEQVVRHQAHSKDSIRALEASDPEYYINFSLDRMLGTALVYAMLDMKNVIRRDQFHFLVKEAAQAPWVQPPGRSFEWFLEMWKFVLEGGIKAPAHIISRMWHVLLLQNETGSWDLSDGLASIFCAGEPKEPLDKQMPTYSSEAVRAALPAELWAACKGNDPAYIETVWCTMLAIALMENTPWDCVVNPSDPPKLARSMKTTGYSWLLTQASHHPGLDEVMFEMQQRAKACIVRWREAFEAEVERLFDESQATKELAMQKTKAKPPSITHKLVSLQSAGSTSRKPGGQGTGLVATMGSHIRRAMNTVYGLAMTFVKLHPLSVIAFATVVDPVRRSDRVLIVSNGFVCTLSLVVALFYSKSSQCCEILAEHLACEGAYGDLQCHGFVGCKDLADAQRVAAQDPPVMLLPEELLPAEYKCDIMPDASLIGQLWVIIIMTAVLLPVSVFYGTLFSKVGNSTHSRVVAYIKTDPVALGKEKKAKAPPLGKAEIVVFTLSTFVLQFDQFNKALTQMLMSVLGPYMNKFATAVERCLAPLKRCFAPLMGLRDPTDTTPIERLRPSTWLHQPGRIAVYTTYMLGWAVAVWILLTYVSVIREMEGKDTEKLVLYNWTIGLVASQFGIVGLRTMVLKGASTWISNQVGRCFTFGGDSVLGPLAWYDSLFLKLAAKRYKSTTEDEEVEMDQDHEGEMDADGDADVDVDVDVDA